MNERSVILGFFLAGVGAASALFAAGPQTPPSPEELQSARKVPLIFEEAGAQAEISPNFIKVAEEPAIAPAGVAAVVDLRKIPADREMPPDSYSYSHRQGAVLQETIQGGSVESRVHPGEPILPTERDDTQGLQRSKGTPGTYFNHFDAGTYTGWIPPDTQMAVGPEYIVEPLNSGFKVFSKAGTMTRGYTSFSGFVNLPTGWAGFCYDPRVVYSNEYGRYLMMIMGKDNTNLKSYYWLMVSQTDDPNGSWWMWRFDTSAGSAGAEEWLDYAAIGVDHWGVYVTGNYFYFPHDKSSRGVRTALWSWPPSYMSGTSGGGYVWSDLQWPSGGQAFTVQPAFPHSQNASGHSFYVNTYSGSGSKILLWTQSGKRHPVDTNPDSPGITRAEIDCKQYYWMGNNVDQPGSGWDIDGGDTRVMDAVYANGRVLATLTLNWDGNRVYSEVYLISLKTSDGTQDWDNAVWSSSFNFFYPALTIQGGNTSEVMLTFSQTEPGNASGYAGVSWFRFNPTTKDYDWWIDRWGDGTYSRWDGDFVGDGRNRWGDYSGAEWDWSCNVAWGDGEYATSSNTWGTRMVARTLGTSDPCSYISVRNPNGGESHDAGDSVTINWERLNIPSGDDIYVELYNGTSYQIIGGPLATSATSFSWTVNNVDTSGAKIFVGSWDAGSTSWTASDTSDAAFTINGKPDLRWTYFNPPGSALQGESFSIGNTVENSGVVSSGGFLVEFRLSTNTYCSTSDTLIGSRYLSNLSGGGASSYNYTPVTVSPSQAPGSYYLCMMVDPYAATGDIDLGNNISYQSVEVVSAEIFADGFETSNTSLWDATVP